MPKLTPQEAAEKWGRRLKGSTEDIRRGVQRVREAPGVRAAAKVEKMRERLVAKIDDGTWEERVSAVPLDEWKGKMLDKGIGRISAGVDAANGKQVEFFGQLFEHQERLQQQLEGMPDLSLEDNINRVTTFLRGMADFRRR